MKRTPGSGQRATAVSADVMDVESQFLRCPHGHNLPNKTNKGTCSPVHCAGGVSVNAPPKVKARAKAAAGRAGKKKEMANKAERAAITAEADAIIDAMIPAYMEEARATAKEVKAQELTRLGQSLGRFAAMRAFFKVPEGLEGAQAEEYVQRRALTLSVDAMAELERQLKLGDDTQRREAARDILDMNGMRKRESGGGNGPVIVMMGQNGGALAVPWAQRLPASSTQTAPALKEVPDAKEHA